MSRTKGRHEAERPAVSATAVLGRTTTPASAGVVAFAAVLGLASVPGVLHYTSSEPETSTAGQVSADTDQEDYVIQPSVSVPSQDTPGGEIHHSAVTLVNAAPAPEPRQEATGSEEQEQPSTERTEDSSPERAEEPEGVGEETSQGSEIPDPPFSASNTGARVLDIAKKYEGVPYVWGGTTPSGWDCSGLTRHVFKEAGVSLPRSSGAQKAAGTPVSAAEARPGDLVWHPGHIGIYAGNGKMYDAGTSAGTSYRSHSWMGHVTYIRVL